MGFLTVLVIKPYLNSPSELRVQCTAYTVYNVQCTYLCIQCTMYIILCTYLYIYIHISMYIHILHISMYTVQLSYMAIYHNVYYHTY